MYKYLLYFLIFSFLGWCAEVVFCILKKGSFENRGLAKGPVCPIYGIGICFTNLLLKEVESFFVLALLAMATATIVEFLVGLFADRILGVRLWDYRGERGNILGYVCPKFSVTWGIASAALIKTVPLLSPIISVFHHPVLCALSYILLIVVILDEKEEMGKKNRALKRMKTS